MHEIWFSKPSQWATWKLQLTLNTGLLLISFQTSGPWVLGLLMCPHKDMEKLGSTWEEWNWTHTLQIWSLLLYQQSYKVRQQAMGIKDAVSFGTLIKSYQCYCLAFKAFWKPCSPSCTRKGYTSPSILLHAARHPTQLNNRNHSSLTNVSLELATSGNCPCKQLCTSLNLKLLQFMMFLYSPSNKSGSTTSWFKSSKFSCPILQEEMK